MKKYNNWVIYGITPINESSMFHEVQKAIHAGKLEQAYLQKVTGWMAPIIVNTQARTIEFLKF